MTQAPTDTRALDALRVDAEGVTRVRPRGKSAQGYTFNDPVNFTDPTGMAPQACCPDGGTGDFDDMKADLASTADAVGKLYEATAGVVKAGFDAIASLVPDEGSPSAGDFQDSGDTQAGGLEMMSSAEMNSNGIVDAAEATDGSSGIVELSKGDLPGGGGSKGKGATGVTPRRVDQVGSATSKARSAGRRTFGDPRPDSTTVFGGDPADPNTKTFRVPTGQVDSMQDVIRTRGN